MAGITKVSVWIQIWFMLEHLNFYTMQENDFILLPFHL